MAAQPTLTAESTAAMSSPPASHPFLRPALTASPSPSPPGSLRTQSTAFYSPMSLPVTPTSDKPSARPASEHTNAPLTVPTTGGRPLSAPTLNIPAPESAIQRNSYPPTLNGHADLNGNISTDVDGSEAPRKLSRWEEKVQGDLGGWRGGKGTPRSSVPHAGVSSSTYYGQPPTGKIGRDLPKEIVRVERDYYLGDVCQFSSTFPLELEARITPAAFQTFIDTLNQPLAEAYSTKAAVIDNLIGIATWWTSLMWRTSHFEKELRRTEDYIREANESIFNPAGLNVLSPRSVGLQFLEIEYY